MSIQYYVDKKSNHVDVILTGNVTDKDAIGFEVEVIDDPDIMPGFSMLVDATSASQIQIPNTSVHSLIEIEHASPSKFRNVRRAYVFKSDECSNWAFQFNAKAKGINRVFYDMGAAINWLKTW